VPGEVFGAEGELDGGVCGEEDGARTDRTLGLFTLVAVLGGEDAGAEDQISARSESASSDGSPS
jgi:hypothetical protein